MPFLDDLGPAYVKIAYHSAFGIHSHTLPTRELVTTGLGDSGSYDTWDEGTIAAATMVETFIDKCVEVVPSTTVYDKYTLYSWNNETQIYNPIFEKSYGGAGTAVGLTGQAKAVQQTISFRTIGFGLLKVAFLDRPGGNNWGNIDPGETWTEIIAEITAASNAWSGRDQYRPFNYTNTSVSLNKRLRRKYGMI